MTISFKKLLLVSLTVLLGVLSLSARAQVPIGDSGYDFSATLSGGGSPGIYAGTVWADVSNSPNYFTNLTVNGTSVVWDGIQYAGYIDSSLSNFGFQYNYNSGYSGASMNNIQSYSYNGSLYTDGGAPPTIVPTGSAPEMNASFLPQVGLLLGCLFFLFGRKKENREPILAA